MADSPIIFSAPMVRALIDGRKTQTRRLIKSRGVSPEFCGGRHDDKNDPSNWGWEDMENGGWITLDQFAKYTFVPYTPGDRLYVRESLKRQDTDQGVGYMTYAADGAKVWPLTEWRHQRHSIPSIHMPREFSRLTLTVTDVRVQRLQDISEEDAVAEGCDAALALTMQRANGGFPGNPRAAFQDLWNSLHGPDAWDANPWVAASTFTVQRGNIDEAHK